MRKALLILAIPLILVYLIGGSDALIEALTRLFVLGALQVVMHVLSQTPTSPRRIKKTERPRLKK